MHITTVKLLSISSFPGGGGGGEGAISEVMKFSDLTMWSPVALIG